MNIPFEITDKDIADGVRGNCIQCPGALAVNRALKAYRSPHSHAPIPCVAVYPNKVGVYRRDSNRGSGLRLTTTCVATPFALWLFAMDFDRGMPVRSMKSSLELPDGFLVPRDAG